jgi:hypothetical protein
MTRGRKTGATRTRTVVAAVALAATSIACATPAPPALLPPDQSHAVRAGLARESARIELGRQAHQATRWPEDRARFDDAVASAWRFVNSHYQPATGMVAPLGAYPIATIWDIGSMIAATYTARELGLIDTATYDGRITRLLATLGRVPLYDGRIFNRTYDTRTGAMLDRQGRVSARGGGGSSTDLGRLLLWLRIVAQDPHHATAAEQVVRRNDFSRTVRKGYLWGETVGRDGKPAPYQEGRIGYEQYAATGFAQWGYSVTNALDLRRNAMPIAIMGEPLLADVRRWDRLTSEPFLLLGLEAGWDEGTATLVRHMLRAQATRYAQTGVVTLASEDSIDQAPYYFYYYCLYTNGKAFGVDTQDRWNVSDGPRWVSAKSAFAFLALRPTEYTDRAVRAVLPARTGRGWTSGTFEGTSRSTNTVDINTAAVIMTAAAYERRSRPLLDQPLPSAAE